MKENDELYIKPESNRALSLLYETLPGRAALKLLTNPYLSQAAGVCLSSPASKHLIPEFSSRNNIDLSEAMEREYNSFNDFFTRTLKEGARKINYDKNALISPCDGFLSVFKIDGDSVFHIKNSAYTIEELLQSRRAPELYRGGYCAIFRLTVRDYHRYCYIDNGTKTKNKFIRGTLHTVNPIATEHYDIYKTNSREYTILHTENFGDVVQIEVGAMMVGRIVNYHGRHKFVRGEEKGRFEFGGSTIVLLFKENTVQFDSKLLKYSLAGYEKKVKLGKKIGEKYICQA